MPSAGPRVGLVGSECLSGLRLWRNPAGAVDAPPRMLSATIDEWLSPGVLIKERSSYRQVNRG